MNAKCDTNTAAVHDMELASMTNCCGHSYGHVLCHDFKSRYQWLPYVD